MATVIRLQRGGRKKRPFYNIVVLDSRKRRDGAFIEKLGYFDPCKSPEVIELDQARAKHWLDLGAQASPRVASLMRKAEAGPEAAEKETKAAEKKAVAEAKAQAAKAEEEVKKAAAEAAGAEAAAESASEEAAVKAAGAGEAEEAPAKTKSTKKAAAKKEEDKAEA